MWNHATTRTQVTQESESSLDAAAFFFETPAAFFFCTPAPAFAGALAFAFPPAAPAAFFVTPPALTPNALLAPPAAPFFAPAPLPSPAFFRGFAPPALPPPLPRAAAALPVAFLAFLAGAAPSSAAPSPESAHSPTWRNESCAQAIPNQTRYNRLGRNPAPHSNPSKQTAMVAVARNAA